ncbi:MAG: glycosyltransferase family 2 protein [Desulfocucumaceae bacterium]
MQDKTVTVIIPAFNEEKTVGDTVIAAFKIKGVVQVIVIDDGSADSTAAIARKNGAAVLALDRNRGKGNAFNVAANHVSGEVVLLLDADLGESAAEADRLLIPLMEGSADITVAVFPRISKKAGFGLVKRLAGAGIRRHTGLNMEAPLSGQRAMCANLFFSFVPFAAGFGVEIDMSIKAGEKGCVIKEIPVSLRHRDTGRNISGFLHRGRQFCHVARVLARHSRWCVK